MARITEIRDDGTVNPADPPLSLTFALTDDHSSCNGLCDMRPHWQSTELVNGVTNLRRRALYLDHAVSIATDLLRDIPADQIHHDDLGSLQIMEGYISKLCPEAMYRLLILTLEELRERLLSAEFIADTLEGIIGDIDG